MKYTDKNDKEIIEPIIDKNGKPGLKRARFALSAVTIFRPVLQDELLAGLNTLLGHLDSDNPDVFRAVDLYGSLCRELLMRGTGLKTYMIEKMLYTENAFSLGAETRGADCLEGRIGEAVKRDLEHLRIIASLQPGTIKKWIADRCNAAGWEKKAISGLPEWGEPDAAGLTNACKLTDTCNSKNYADKGYGDTTAHVPGKSSDVMQKQDAGFIYDRFMNSASWHECAKDLAEFHKRWGSGIFSKYRAFVWKNKGRDGYFKPVGFPDPVKFSDLISYELEREEIIENTLRFLDGYPANNILLYGDRGTGKSSTVKALVNEYYGRGLRMIEVPKKLLPDYPAIISRLAGRNLKFILFVDDMSIEENEANYTALKAALEGGLEDKPSNVLIYATSNRKHLIRERFSERAGLLSGNADDEVRAADTMQEKLSLSDRFGMTLVFSTPDKKRYLDIVEGIARNRGLEIDRDFMHREALKWELRFNGRSPRTAKQFVDWLEGTILSGRQP